MMGKVLGIFFGLAMMVVVVHGFWCHECMGGAACDTVEAGKNSTFAKNCTVYADVPAACFSSGKEGIFERKCFRLTTKDKVGCNPSPNDGGETCFCTEDFCNGKKSTSGPNGPGSPDGAPGKGGAGWNKPSDNFLNFCLISIIIIIQI